MGSESEDNKDKKHKTMKQEGSLGHHLRNTLICVMSIQLKRVSGQEATMA